VTERTPEFLAALAKPRPEGATTIIEPSGKTYHVFLSGQIEGFERGSFIINGAYLESREMCAEVRDFERKGKSK
jgi:hypothetical protein